MRRRLGDIWLIGGIDPSLYATATAQEMTDHAARNIDAMRGQRKFILDGEEIPVAARIANVRAVADLVAAETGFYG